MNMMSSSRSLHFPSPSTGSRYGANNTDSHSSKIYGAEQNYLTPSFNRISTLPPKSKFNSSSRIRVPRTGTSFNSPAERNKHDFKTYQPSPPKQSYTFQSSSVGSDLVRPAMRATKSRNVHRPVLPSNSSNHSNSVGLNHRSSYLDGTPGRERQLSPLKERLHSPTREPPSLTTNQKSQSSSSLKFSTSSTTSCSCDNDGDVKLRATIALPRPTFGDPDKSPVLSARNSPVSNRSVTRKSKEQITINDPPYKNSYEPSYSKSSTPNHLIESRSPTVPGGDGATGLKNIGNTCFMNSILQCLSHSVQLRDYCLRSQYKFDLNEQSSMKGRLMIAFAGIINDLWSGTSNSVIPVTFKAQIQKFSPRFMGYEQQDCQEFLRFLLEGLHEDINEVKKKSSEPLKDLSDKRPQEIAQETWKWYGRKDSSFIFNLFVGQLESNLVCSKCGHVSLTYDPFWDLSLPISKVKHSYPAQPPNLADCLQTFTKEEILDHDEKPMCEKCKTRQRMTKKLSIHRFPKILVIHLKRFHEGSRYRQKDSSLVKFPVLEQLRLHHFSSQTCEDPTFTNYDLYAVSNHGGSCYGGHYTAYCLNPSTNEWRMYDDSRVTKMSEYSVCTKEAYVLFYVQKRSSRL